MIGIHIVHYDLGSRAGGGESMKRFDSMTIHRAMQSEYADRLVEIAVEHARLAREAITLRHGVDAEIIDTRIPELRAERDGILEMFEGDES